MAAALVSALPDQPISPISPLSYNDAPAHVKPTNWERFVSAVWDPDYAIKSHAERKLVFKLDTTLLAALTIGWWLKNIDQTNLSNAYVSGMKEDLHITGNQYTYMSVIYNAVVCVGCLVANFILLKLRPSWFIAGMELGWGIFTFAQAGAQSYQAMYGFRFAVAFFESCYYPAAYFCLGSWYTKQELRKRMGLWFIAGPAGSAFSGYMQAAIYKNLNGHAGLAGWRWLYIICGIMTVPVGLIMFFLLPDFPETTRAFFLNEEERALARSRVTRNGVEPVTGQLRGPAVVAALRSWKSYAFILWYAIFGLAVQNGSQFAVYLKAAGYSVSSRNVLSSTMYVIEIPFVFGYALIADRMSARWRPLVIVLPCVWGIFITGILAFWGHSNKLRVFSFMLNGSLYVSPVFYAWIADVCGSNTELRAFITGGTACMFYMFNAWLPAIIFKQTDGPRFKKGFQTDFGFMIFSVFFALVIWYFVERERRQQAADRVPGSSGTGSAGYVEEDKVPSDEEKAQR